MERECDVADVTHRGQLVLLGPSTGEVGTRAELAVGTGDDDHTIDARLADLAKGGEQLVPHHTVERVLLRRAVECDGDDAVVAADVQGFHESGRY